jgi:hypothetical protein
VGLVFEGPVRSGFFPIWVKTGTATGSFIFAKCQKPDWTAHNRLCAVQSGFWTGCDRPLAT